jgi:hypothetical protein
MFTPLVALQASKRHSISCHTRPRTSAVADAAAPWLAPETASQGSWLAVSSSECCEYEHCTWFASKSKWNSKLIYGCQSVSQSVSQSVCLVAEPTRKLVTRYYFLSEDAVWKLRSCFCWGPSLTRGRVCSLQFNHSMVRRSRNPRIRPYGSITLTT